MDLRARVFTVRKNSGLDKMVYVTKATVRGAMGTTLSRIKTVDFFLTPDTQ